MGAKRMQNLKMILNTVPAGFLVDAAWLTARGVAYESLRDYVKRGWLERVSRGVFRRPVSNAPAKKEIDWRTCILSAQHIMNYDVHVGGMTALNLQGYSHYLYLGGHPPVSVYGKTLPKWLHRLPLDASINAHNVSLFSDPSLGLKNDDVDPSNTLPWDWQLKMSTLERAAIETMDGLPHRESFHMLDMAFQSLTNLRPKLLSALLHSCRKIKVRRMFFAFADRHDHSWRARLNPEEFDLGSGDRALFSGGKMHPRYRIMVPKEFVTTEADYAA